MKKNNWKSMVGCTVATMTICMGATALAADTNVFVGNGAVNGTKNQPSVNDVAGDASNVPETVAQITKELKLAEGITIPRATFHFTADKITEDAPEAEIESVSYSAEDLKGDLSEGVYKINKAGKITFGEFPHAGEYQYHVQETADTYDTASGEVMTYSTETYTMHVYVINTENGGTEVEKITASNTAGDKVSEMNFENIYIKNDASLTISKTTAGKNADRTKDFAFTLTFTKSGTATDDTYEGMIGNEKVEFKAGEAKTFELHDGEKIVFTNIPAGTRYAVTETGTAYYTPSVEVVENGVKTVDVKAVKGQSLSSAEAGATNLVGEGNNSADFTNTFDDVPITGVILENLPFTILIGAAAVLLAMGTFVKRFKKEK